MRVSIRVAAQAGEFKPESDEEEEEEEESSGGGSSDESLVDSDEEADADEEEEEEDDEEAGKSWEELEEEALRCAGNPLSVFVHILLRVSLSVGGQRSLGMS